MKFDNFAREAGKAVKSAADQAERPAISKIEARGHRRSVAGASLVIAAVVLVASFVTFWPDSQSPPVASNSIGTTEPTLVPSTVPESFADFLGGELGSQWGVVPGSTPEGDRSVIDVTFTDGHRVQMLYPADWPLDEYGWTPDTDVVYELEEPRDDGTGVLHAQILFSYGADEEWSIRLHPMSLWTDEELALAESNIELEKQANGFVTVQTTRPFSHYTRDPNQAPINPDYKGQNPGIYVDDIFGMATIDSCIDDPEDPYPQRDTERISWCDEDAGVIVTFTVPEIYHDDIHDQVDVRLVTTTEQPTSSTSVPQASPTTALPAQFPAIRSDIGLGWEAVELPTSVAFCHQAVIPTEQEIVIWGGNQASCEYESPVGDPGLAYNPNTGTWRQLPEGPLDPAVAPTGVWNGTEILVCCGMEGIGPVGGGEIGSSQAAAYDPQTDSWRSLPDAPLGGPFPEAVWTGSEMMVVTQSGVAAFNPTTDSWRDFSPMPEDLGRTNEIVWTGTELVVWPRFPVGDPLRRVEEGMALDPTTGTWRVLPDPQPWPSWVDMVVTDDSIIIWGGLPANQGGSERAVGAQYDLDLGTWRPVPEALPEPDGCECNLGSQTLTWTGEYVLVSPGMFSTGVDPDTPVLIAYHPVTNSWILVDEQSPLAWGGDSLTVGDRLVIVAKDVFYTSPPNWQPTGEPITQASWSD